MNITITPLKLSNGWSGRAASFNASNRNFSEKNWTDCLAQPELLFENVEKILKTENQNCVAVKNLTIADSNIKVVIKRHNPQAGLRQFFRSFCPPKAIRNFKTAVKLLRYGLPVAAPLAAIYKRRKLRTTQSIYIAEYCQDSSDLHTFACEKLPQVPTDSFAVKKELCRQLATILATLHKNGLWHRDSKANNFSVYKDTENTYKILLTDMDGIKRYSLQRRSRQFRTLWQLAASVFSVPAVMQTDHLRTFTIYCKLVGIKPSKQRQIFRELANRAKAKHLRSISKT
ncbi:MAG: lipopolysaccharide kinase InaA family protein [Planctomycetota bacterium]